MPMDRELIEKKKKIKITPVIGSLCFDFISSVFEVFGAVVATTVVKSSL